MRKSESGKRKRENGKENGGRGGGRVRSEAYKNENVGTYLARIVRRNQLLPLRVRWLCLLISHCRVGHSNNHSY